MKNCPLVDLEYLRDNFSLDLACPSGLRRGASALKYFSHLRQFNRHTNNCAHLPIGYLNSRNYYCLRIKKRKYFCHRIIYCLYHNTEPESIKNFDIDHIDRNQSNNNPENLRLIPHSDNCLNIPIKKNNSSGFTGISWHNEQKRWHINLTYNKQTFYLGVCIDLEEAFYLRYKKLKELNISHLGQLYDPNNPEACRIFEKIKQMEANGEL